MGLKSESTGNKYRKIKKMWNDFSDETGDFTNLNQTDKNDIEFASGMQLLTSLNVFSTWMLIQPKKVLDGQKKLRRSP